jgi:hypothetical protein
MALIQRCAGLRPGPVTTVAAAAKHTLRAIARRWQYLTEETKTHETLIARLTRELAPQLVEAFGIGPDTAAEVLIVAGDNPSVSAPNQPGPNSAASHPSPPRPG